MNRGRGAIAYRFVPTTILLACVAAGLLTVSGPAEARKKPIHRVVHAAAPAGPLPPNSSMEIDADTGPRSPS